jgi:hypothetical protein
MRLRLRMPSTLLLAAAFLASLCGLAWLAVAMEAHWQQVLDHRVERRTAIALRLLGAASLLASLLLCLRVDHPSMAALVWIMTLATAAIVVAFTLTWRPRALAWLAPWMRLASRLDRGSDRRLDPGTD